MICIPQKQEVIHSGNQRLVSKSIIIHSKFIVFQQKLWSDVTLLCFPNFFSFKRTNSKGSPNLSFHPYLYFFSPEMNSQVFFPSPSLVLFFITILVLVQIPMFLCYDWYSSCKNQYSCGYITDIGYPFWGNGRVSGCGNPSLYLSCEHNTTFIYINNVKYLVLGVVDAHFFA